VKYLVALISGVLVGGLLFAVLLYNNPLVSPVAVSPLAVTQNNLLELNFSAAPADTIATIGNSSSRVPSHPARVDDLWEPAISDTRILITTLQSGRGQPAGVGIKFLSMAEEPGLLQGRVPANSAWHLWLRGRGSLFVDQTENLWFLLREVVAPAYLDSSDSWRGSWFGITTSGPGALGTARVTGGSGEFAGSSGEAVEAISAKAYSVENGPVSMDVHLSISIDSP
jgi:hypothetical protein